MNNQKSLALILCALVMTSVGCSKYITQPKSNDNTIDSSQEMICEETPVDEVVIADNVDDCIAELESQDTVVFDVVAIPQDEDIYEAITFSDEQSKSIVLPEYKDADINDISLMLTEMGADDFHYPTDTSSYVTSPYGWRKGKMHAGVDLKVYVGDNIYAAFDGVVRIAKYYGAYGYCVVIRHYNGLETLYAHSSKLLVGINDEVKAGQVIALGGSTGRSTGSHLHFEVRVAGNYINPSLLIDTNNHSLQSKNLYITRRNNRIFASNNDSAEEREADIIAELSIKYHIVKSGDVLSRIAVNNSTTVATLCKLNNISSKSTLRIGQRLIVRDGIRPTTSSTQQTAVASSSTTTPAASNTTRSASSTASAQTSVYVVKSGDTLSAIAQRNNTSISSICSLNNISSRTTLQIGQKLTLNGRALSNSSGTTTYTVKKGDTLSKIAAHNHTTVNTICQLNNISSRTTLQIGQKLAIAAM